jgi:hypothetical protein
MINKESYIQKQSKKIKVVLSTLFTVLRDEGMCTLYQRKVIKTVISQLSSVLEPSVLKAMDEIMKDNT